MNIKLTDEGFLLSPENQAEFFQLEILWNNRQDFKLMKNVDSVTGDLISLDIKVLTNEHTD